MARTLVGRPMEILLVEDNLDDARVAIQALKQNHVCCRVSLVCDGVEAMAFLERKAVFARAPRPDVILLDMDLPKKDGRQVLSEIRGSEQLHRIPVVVLTGSRVHAMVLEAQGLRVDEFMTKPVDFEKFIHVVRSLRHCWMSEVILPALD